jgi:hypothetical protein
MFMQWLVDISTWWSTLSEPAQFFFLIPFLVAFVGLIADRPPDAPDAEPADAAQPGAGRPDRHTKGWRRHTIRG